MSFGEWKATVCYTLEKKTTFVSIFYIEISHPRVSIAASIPLISLSKCYCFPGNFKGRAEILHSSIHLKNVTRKDSAKYRCEISAPTEQGQGTGEVEISLLVLGKKSKGSYQQFKLNFNFNSAGQLHFSLNLI